MRAASPTTPGDHVGGRGAHRQVARVLFGDRPRQAGGPSALPLYGLARPLMAEGGARGTACKASKRECVGWPSCVRGASGAWSQRASTKKQSNVVDTAMEDPVELPRNELHSVLQLFWERHSENNTVFLPTVSKGQIALCSQ